jgi:hypothetical protein
MTYSFNARLFAAVAGFRAENEIRYHLCGVHLAPHPSGRGALAVATDGHQMAMAYDEHGEASEARTFSCWPHLVTAAWRHRAARVSLIDGRLRVLDETQSELYVQPGEPTIQGGQFPNYTRLLPKDPSTLRPVAGGTFGSTLILRLGGVARRLGSRHFGGLQQWQLPSESVTHVNAMFTRFTGEPNLMVITMPMRGDYLDSAVPGPLHLNAA